MDEETKARFDALDARFDALMTHMDDQFERVMASLTTLLIAFQAERLRLERRGDAS